MKHVIRAESNIGTSIVTVRDHKVILDADLARIYGVETKRLNEQVKRNHRRFPRDFMFRLTKTETEDLRSQIATSNKERGGRRYTPYVFTEHGAIMAANVLNSPYAVQMSVYVVRAFVQLRHAIAQHKELTTKLKELERSVASHDGHIKTLFEAIRQLMASPEGTSRRIGFRGKEEN